MDPACSRTVLSPYLFSFANNERAGPASKSELLANKELFPDEGDKEVFIPHALMHRFPPSRFRDQVSLKFRKQTLAESQASVAKLMEKHSVQVISRHKVYGLAMNKLEDIEVPTAAAVFRVKKSWFVQFTKVHNSSLWDTKMATAGVL